MYFYIVIYIYNTAGGLYVFDVIYLELIYYYFGFSLTVYMILYTFPFDCFWEKVVWHILLPKEKKIKWPRYLS